MSEDSLKDFTVNWIIGGVLLFSLLTFTITFMYDNESIGLDDGTGDLFLQDYNNISNELVVVTEDSNSLLNLTSNTNPEVSDLGSRDSVAAAYKSRQSAVSNWENSKRIISWVFSGESGKVIISVIGGIIGFLSVFYIWRFIKSGS